MIILEVRGCDDNTLIEVTEEEVAEVQGLIDRVFAASSYGCQPKIWVHYPGDEYYDDALEDWNERNKPTAG